MEKLSQAIELFIANHAGVTLQINEQNGEPVQIFKPYEPAQIDFFSISAARITLQPASNNGLIV
ncbi:hypothetical protein ACFSQ7_19285 [Paenibacillus rhizoplanae]